jgi:hypothetical protein
MPKALSTTSMQSRTDESVGAVNGVELFRNSRPPAKQARVDSALESVVRCACVAGEKDRVGL